MHNILFEYEMPPTTWVYVSALMTIGIYFKFRRLLSVRNLDLIGLILFSPGLLLVSHGKEQLGYLWLFSVTGFFLVRMLLDQVMVRRPLLEPNLSASGLTFTGVALMVFMIGTVVTEPVPKAEVEAVKEAEQITTGEPAEKAKPPAEAGVAASRATRGKAGQHGPGYALFYLVANFASEALVPADEGSPSQARRTLVRQATVRSMAILGHLAIVIGMVLIGYRHFDNVHTGVAAASLYLLSPYTAQQTSEVIHVVPGALLVWAVVSYRRPAVAGILLGLAAGVVFYPLFLLPLWLGFYWRRGLLRFSAGMASTLLGLILLLMLAPGTFLDNLGEMFGLGDVGVSGFWEYHAEAFRTPVKAAFVVICGSFALWPAQKNLGTLLACSAAVMLAAQFWHPVDGGLYMAWYLPLLILTIFRPNLEDRVALTALTEGWIPWRKPIPGVEGA